jgi:hypothetical protein
MTAWPHDARTFALPRCLTDANMTTTTAWAIINGKSRNPPDADAIAALLEGGDYLPAPMEVGIDRLIEKLEAGTYGGWDNRPAMDEASDIHMTDTPKVSLLFNLQNATATLNIMPSHYHGWTQEEQDRLVQGFSIPWTMRADEIANVLRAVRPAVAALYAGCEIEGNYNGHIHLEWPADILDDALELMDWLAYLELEANDGTLTDALIESDVKSA